MMVKSLEQTAQQRGWSQGCACSVREREGERTAQAKMGGVCQL